MADSIQKSVQMGLGEAIQRLLRVELLLQKGLTKVPETTRLERQMILDALNTKKLDLGFDCNSDGMPDNVDIFAASAATSCCRIMPNDTSRTVAPVSSRRASSSRKKKTGDTNAESD